MADFALFFITNLDNAAQAEFTFDNQKREAISNHLNALFRDVWHLSGKHFGTTLVWDPTPADITQWLKPNSGIIHFTRNFGAGSVLRKAGATIPVPATAQGATENVSDGVMAEVFVEGGNAVAALGHRAFHELMHFKLDIGQNIVQDIHKQGGGGLATDQPLQGTEKITSTNARLMAGHILDTVKMSKRFM